MVNLLFLILAHPFLDSLKYYYIDVFQPELHTLVMEAKCSVFQDDNIRIYFSKEEGLRVESESSEACGLVKSFLLSTGLGLCSIWESFEETKFADTVREEGANVWLTIIPEEPGLFTRAILKMDKDNWLIKEVKVTTEEQEILAQITYKSRLPVNITVTADSLKSKIKHTYIKDKGLLFPSKTEVIQQGPNLPKELKHITITYSNIKINPF